MPLEAAVELKVGELIDHRDDVGKSREGRISALLGNCNFAIEYKARKKNWIVESNAIKDL